VGFGVEWSVVQTGAPFAFSASTNFDHRIIRNALRKRTVSKRF
jgi:hypothetical protein